MYECNKLGSLQDSTRFKIRFKVRFKTRIDSLQVSLQGSLMVGSGTVLSCPVLPSHIPLPFLFLPLDSNDQAKSAERLGGGGVI